MLLDRLRGLLARYRFMTVVEDDNESDVLEVSPTPDCEVLPMHEVKPRERAKVRGIVQAVTLSPQQGSRVLRASLSDGTGNIVLNWFARNEIPGVRPGARIQAEGVVTLADGALSILNPRYDLLPETVSK